MLNKSIILLLCCLCLPFSALANRQELAEKLTEILIPLEEHTTYFPVYAGILTKTQLPMEVEKEVGPQVFGALINAMVKARAEVFTENELNAAINYFQSSTGKEILKKTVANFEAKGNVHDLSVEEIEFFEKFEKSPIGRSISAKRAKVDEFFIIDVEKIAAKLKNSKNITKQ